MSSSLSLSGNEIELRKQEEIDFHNQREVDRKRLTSREFEAKYSNKKWYSIVESSRKFCDRWLEENCRDAVALDYCCGLGGMSLKLAEYGANVEAIDISDESVHTTAELLQSKGFGDRCNAQVMDGENLTFADNTFDVIICSGVLHHLDLKNAYPQLARVLKPTGKILCMEALGHNPLINTYRRMTPSLRTAWEVDHIIRNRDLKFAEDFFGAVRCDYFHLCAIAAAPLRSTPIFKPMLKTLDLVDNLILRIPGVRQMAWQIVFELSQPKKS